MTLLSKTLQVGFNFYCNDFFKLRTNIKLHTRRFLTQVFTRTYEISNGRGNQTPKPKRQSPTPFAAELLASTIMTLILHFRNFLLIYTPSWCSVNAADSWPQGVEFDAHCSCLLPVFIYVKNVSLSPMYVAVCFFIASYFACKLQINKIIIHKWPASSLVVFLGKALNGITSTFELLNW